VEPPKIGLGVFGFNFGALHTTGVSATAGFPACPSAARTTTTADAGRRDVDRARANDTDWARDDAHGDETANMRALGN